MVDDEPPGAQSAIRDSAQLDLQPVHHDADDDTFHEMLSIHLDQPVGSMSISPANRDVALGACKGLYIVDLQNPYDPPRFLPHESAWEVADVQWNPFPARSEWVASTSNQKAIIYNLSQSRSLSLSPIEHTLHAHTRAVTDINWAAHTPDILATCGLDGWVWAWDLRVGFGKGASKPVWGVCSWNQGATQVKWNRREQHIIASAHGKHVKVWDDRMGAVPIHTIEGHSSKIYGIDWSRLVSNEIVTCSLDASFKYWSIDSAEPKLTVQTSAPVWRARNLPFGRGVLTLPQRSDYALSIWSFDQLQSGNEAEPVARFEGAREGVQEFVWRTRGGNDLSTDNREFQLVTWAKDRRLRLWPISDEILQEVGHVKGGPITIPVTRRNCPNISYRTLQQEPAVPITFSPPPPATSEQPQLAASPPGRSLLTSSLLTASLGRPPANAVKSPANRWRAPTMSTNPIRSRRHRAAERLAWMEGVKVIRPTPQAVDKTQRSGSHGAADGPGHETRSSSLVRGTDAGTLREDVTNTERPESAAGSRTVASTAREDRFQNLGEELVSAVRRLPRVNFEKLHVAQRSCTVSLYRPEFMRATFTFPKTYPASSPPTVDIERSRDVTIKQRNSLLRQVRRFMAEQAQSGQPSFEKALRLLMATPESVSTIDDDDDAGPDDDKRPQPSDPQLERNNKNSPPPARCGAIFSPTGRLVMFRLRDPLLLVQAIAAPAEPKPSVSSSKQPARISEAFGNLADGGAADYNETDEALLAATGTSFRPSGMMLRRASLQQVAELPTFDPAIRIRDVSHLTIVQPGRVMPDLALPPPQAVEAALEQAVREGDAFLTLVWRTVDALCTGSNTVPDSLTSDRLLQALMALLGKMGDIQTLGVTACLLQSLVDAPLSPTGTAYDDAVSPVTPSVDYFSHRQISSNAATPYDRTPRADLTGPSSQSPKASWANLGSFFNTSVLSLRSNTPPTPSSSERMQMLRTPSWTRPLASPARSVTSQPRAQKRSRMSPGVTFGHTQVIEEADVVTEEKSHSQTNTNTSRRVVVTYPEYPIFETKPVPWWRSARAQIDLELVRLAYAALLERWQDHQAKVEVLKRCHSTDDFAGDIIRAQQGLSASSAIVIARTCTNCGQTKDHLGSMCTNCRYRSRPLSCSLCRLPVTGLARPCTVCLHVGHVDCLDRWFRDSTERDCPTGCGCKCVTNGGSEGFFEARAVVRPALKRAHDTGGRMPFFQ